MTNCMILYLAVVVALVVISLFMRKTCALIIVLLLFVSCQHVSRWASLPAPIYIERESDQEAVDEFNSRFESPIFEYSEGENAITIGMVKNIVGRKIGESELHFDDSGFQSVEIRIEQRIFDSKKDNLYLFALIHELGHALGAPHMDSGIMQAIVPDKGDVEDLIEPLIDWIAENYPVEKIDPE